MADGSAVRSELRSIEAHEKGYSGGKKKTVFLKKKTRRRFILVASSQSSEGAVVAIVSQADCGRLL